MLKKIFKRFGRSKRKAQREKLNREYFQDRMMDRMEAALIMIDHHMKKNDAGVKGGRTTVVMTRGDMVSLRCYVHSALEHMESEFYGK